MRIAPIAIALVAASAAFIAACGGDSTNPSGPTSAGHRYSVDISINALGGNICEWSIKDHSSLVVTMDPATLIGSVSNIINTQAQLLQTKCNGTCTEELLNSPRGPIDIASVNIVGEHPVTHQVTVSYNANVEDPKFRDTCGGTVTTVGGTAVTIGTALQFFDNGASQDVLYVDPAFGQSFHMVVTPIPQ